MTIKHYFGGTNKRSHKLCDISLQKNGNCSMITTLELIVES